MQYKENPKVIEFIDKAKLWNEEFRLLINIARETELLEEFKWGKPCYTLNDANVFLIHGFKEYCALLFFKGTLLNDNANILIKQTDNVQSARQIRFKNSQQILSMQNMIKEYIAQAVAVENSGVKVEFKKTEEFVIVPELLNLFNVDVVLKMAFEKLTPGRQRAYLLYFSSAKQQKTRISRIEKYIPKILNGKGMDD
ncbi:YdeI/OmpD-associated family protein [Pseudaquidulcibacter saccharophilus]|uniref:YdeI/OmpD-associated family protein n=1 Tax=Pseudaquidulcibacter saccharophilus TaxID=2831900 RepID=UPI001EFF26FA|nr:DUF1801 domain-containing protein [Pseudaquidulcibacter saccharophilus]